MENYNEKIAVQNLSVVEAQKEYLARVYAWMVGGLVTTGITSGLIMSSETMLGWIAENFTLIWMLMFVEIGLVVWLSARIEKISQEMAGVSFLVYSFINGITLSIMALIYTSESLTSTFFVAAGMFAAMSVYGFVTKRDLSGIGSFLFMGVIGIVIASVVNIWLGSSMIHFLVSVVGVITFTGLTAYDTQKIKEMYVLEAEGAAVARKGAIIGALSLYLDFINLFLFLLRLLGSRR